MNEFQRKLLDKVGANSYIATLADAARTVLAIEPYAYVVDVDGAIAPFGGAQQALAIAVPVFPGTLDVNVIMDNDSDFLWCATCGAARIVGSVDPQTFANIPTPDPSVLVQISDRSKGVTLYNGFVPMPLIAGQSGYPFLLNSPKLIKPRSTLKVQFTRDANFPTNSLGGVYLVLHGAKIFYA